MRSVFVDTNVLIYLQDTEEATKAAAATRWVERLAKSDDIVISAQVLNEFVSVSMKRYRYTPIPELHMRARTFLPWCHAPLGAGEVERAMNIQMQYRTSWWDALIVSSALAADCRFILSEDMQDGMTFGRTKVVHPFRNAPEAIVR